MIKITTLTLLISAMSFVNPGHNKIKPLKTGLYYVVDKPNQFKRQLEKSNEVCFLDPTPIVTAKQFSKLVIEKDEIRHNNMAVIKLNDAATTAFSLATKKYIHQKIALIIDDQLIIAPTVQAQIPSGIVSVNRAEYSTAELDRLVKVVKAEMKW